ncbi:hypothetical protein QAD02_002685 [Eretmocerus hayati]|uniref:Uncharacterized protein n=1 Tax=Eretmocerus hayati TaxID=131215 RepID=A0ACC2NLC6_9HYME|nr:hypothetical protein QAD02_002685 [Eretmocerus hayati]
MEKATLINTIKCVFNYAQTHESHIRSMCSPRWQSDLRSLSIEVLRRKLRFLLMHISYRSINNLYKKGVLGRECIVPIVCDVLKKKYGSYSDFRDLVDLVHQNTVRELVQGMMLDAEGDAIISSCNHEDLDETLNRPSTSGDAQMTPTEQNNSESADQRPNDDSSDKNSETVQTVEENDVVMDENRPSTSGSTKTVPTEQDNSEFADQQQPNDVSNDGNSETVQTVQGSNVAMDENSHSESTLTATSTVMVRSQSAPRQVFMPPG